VNNDDSLPADFATGLAEIRESLEHLRSLHPNSAREVLCGLVIQAVAARGPDSDTDADMAAWHQRLDLWKSSP
jgi:hypothetical protein